MLSGLTACLEMCMSDKWKPRLLTQAPPPPHRRDKLVRGGLAGKGWSAGPGGQTAQQGWGQRLDTVWAWHQNQEVEPAGGLIPERRQIRLLTTQTPTSTFSCFSHLQQLGVATGLLWHCWVVYKMLLGGCTGIRRWLRICHKHSHGREEASRTCFLK